MKDCEERETRSWAKRTSILGRWSLIGGAIALPLLRGQPRASLRAAAAVGLATGAAKAVKHAIDRWRPDGSNEDSFPSGHTADASAAAAAIAHGSPGPAGTAAGGLALVTGIARWRCRKHHVGDVAAGALIGLAAERIARRLLPPR